MVWMFLSSIFFRSNNCAGSSGGCLFAATDDDDAAIFRFLLLLTSRAEENSHHQPGHNIMCVKQLRTSMFMNFRGCRRHGTTHSCSNQQCDAPVMWGGYVIEDVTIGSDRIGSDWWNVSVEYWRSTMKVLCKSENHFLNRVKSFIEMKLSWCGICVRKLEYRSVKSAHIRQAADVYAQRKYHLSFGGYFVNIIGLRHLRIRLGSLA